MAFVKLGSMPSPPKSRVSTIPSLSGGLNIADIPWQVANNQSPEMKNMWWQNGALRNRDWQTTYNNGLVKAIDDDSTAEYESSAYGMLYHGWYVTHCGGKLQAITKDLTYFETIKSAEDDTVDFEADFPAGTFFTHNEVLYYKTRGAYIKITLSDKVVDGVGLYGLRASDVKPYVPTMLMNADPENQGAGDLYQPINRLTSKRKVLFNCKAETKKVILPEYADSGSITAEYLNNSGLWVEITDLEVVRSIAKAEVYLDFPEGIKDLGDAATNNFRVTYSVSGTENEYESIMDCNIAEVYGGGVGLCVVLAGCLKQPNAYFWSANTDVSMDPGYFPVEHYNLAGDASDPITAFGKQQNMLIIFQKNRIGKCEFGTTTMEGRTFITMEYTIVNPVIGCDLPRSIQLIENNLVFAHKNRGVLLIRDSSSAYENNVVVISTNVDRSIPEAGLLYDLNSDPGRVCSIDDGKRYWICANGHAWLWDYSLGGSITDTRKLSWFYFDNIQNPAAWFGYDDHRYCFIGCDGYLRQFQGGSGDTTYEDGTWRTRGEDFEKVVTLPIQEFGTYEVLKNVNKAIFVVQGDGGALIDIEYETDYGKWLDREPIMTRSWSLAPRNLTYRSLKVFNFAVTAVRKLRCLHIRHFKVTLSNKTRGEGFAFISAQIYYSYSGEDR